MVRCGCGWILIFWCTWTCSKGAAIHRDCGWPAGKWPVYWFRVSGILILLLSFILIIHLLGMCSFFFRENFSVHDICKLNYNYMIIKALRFDFGCRNHGPVQLSSASFPRIMSLQCNIGLWHIIWQSNGFENVSAILIVALLILKQLALKCQKLALWLPQKILDSHR